MSASSPSAAAIFCFCSISSTVEIRSRKIRRLPRIAWSRPPLPSVPQRPVQISMPAFEKQPHIADGFRIGLSRWSDPPRMAPDSGGCDTAGTGAYVRASEVHVAGRHLEMAVNEVDQPVRQIAREVRTVVGAPSFLRRRVT